MNEIKLYQLNPESILVINREGELKRKKTPFSVSLITKIEGLKEGDTYLVRLVIPNTNWMMSYVITGNGAGYPYYCFAIL